MFYEKYVAIERMVDLTLMTLPEEDLVASEDGLMENHQYFDVRGVSFSEAREIIDEENELLKKILEASEVDQEDTVEDISEALREDISPLSGFDIGVGGLVFALSSIGCTPISSCNGGVVGGHHAHEHPWIIFYAPKNVVDILLRAAEHANVGLLNNDGGMLEVFSNNVLAFNRMADVLISADHA